MDKTKRQHFNYTHEALPMVFHHQTSGFMKYLENDGIKFLEFWWNHVGKQLDDSLLSSFKGAAYEIHDLPEKKSKVFLVKLPPVEEFGEIHMMAFVKLPEKRIPMVQWPSTRIIALEHVEMKYSETGTLLAEITPRARFIPIGPGPKPVMSGFYTAVLNYIWKPKGNKKS
jgi:hypothetical protein